MCNDLDQFNQLINIRKEIGQDINEVFTIFSDKFIFESDKFPK